MLVLSVTVPSNPGGPCILMLAAALGICTGVRAQTIECADLKPASLQPPGYARSADGRRCEGFYEQQVQAPFLELLSLFRRVDAEPPAPLVLTTGHTGRRIVVRPLLQGVGYRADLLVTAGNASWDPQPMLAATRLRVDQLGFLAGSGERPTTSTAYLPVSLAGSKIDGPIVAAVRTAVATTNVSWRALDDAGGFDQPWTPIVRGGLSQWGLAVIEMKLPPGPTPTTIQVRASASDGTPIPVLQFRVEGLR